MKTITVIGEILVEIMADAPGHGFLEPTALTGPFPSGAPAIYIDQAARLGQPCGMISAVGNDDFGRINLARLARDGVDISAITTDPDLPTGTAFVRYRPDGNRDFVFNIRHSACGSTTLSAAAHALLDQTDHLHVMGSSLFSASLLHANLTAIEIVKALGGTVSFDPNLRREILGAPGMQAAMARILGLCDLYLPSGPELTLLTTAQTEAEAIAELLQRGPKAVIHKAGAAGVTWHDRNGSLHQPAFTVAELDPTGAGDCFAAAFTCFWLRGLPITETLRFAAAAGALAVTQRGPMEGAATLAQLLAFAK